ncbi:unnamed protein product [Durusdinium trenchii]|uniref:Pseudouridine synthase RsuA/RluA-like domain-containing protein n=1 Tax=Durusdinium trenchii TaxID=1381693 RepID=A0ABP0IN89_9DINO
MARAACFELSALGAQAGKTCKALSTCCGIGQILFPASEDPSPAGAKMDESGASRESSLDRMDGGTEDPQQIGAEPEMLSVSKESETELAAERGSTESDTALPDDLPEEPETAFNSDQSDRFLAEPRAKPDVGRSLLELLRSGQPKPCAVDGSGSGIDSSSESQEQRDEIGAQVPLLQGVGGLSCELWEYFVRPLMDSRHSKAFVGHESFKGSPIPGSRPQVLIDRRKDTHMMAMFKPSGWATCSTPQWEGLEGNLIRHVWCYYNAPTAAPCHRLDKGTSGIVLVATSKIASKYICQQILSKTLVKQYVGLCHGLVTPGMGVFSAPLALSRADRPLGACSTEGREAVTRYRVLGYFRSHRGSYTLVQVLIEHGRQHQIRLHMASLGHPIVADGRYNPYKAKDDAEICPRLFLHACYLRCTLLKADSEEPEAFTVACNLPMELRRVLVSELGLDRTASSQLPLEAQQLCDALLFPEEAKLMSKRMRSEDLSDLHESRLALRRREEFLHRFGFNAKERAEVLRILNQLKTSKERSAALQQFRVLGQRTPDFIVGRFAKYVEGLLRWNQNKAVEDDIDVYEAPEEPAADQPLRPSVVAVEPMLGLQAQELLRSLQSSPQEESEENLRVDGPLQILTEPVWCDVCGLTEKQVSVCTANLSVKMRQPGIFGRRAPCQPVRRRRQVRDVRQWVAKGGGRGAQEEQEESDEDECEEEVDEEDDEDVEDDSEAEANEDTVTSSSMPRRWMSRALSSTQPAPMTNPSSKTSEESSRERSEKVKDLENLVHELLQGNGGQVDGMWLAGKVATGFNLHVRENSKLKSQRSDGSLKKWLMSIPGVVVETPKDNTEQWRVRCV